MLFADLESPMAWLADRKPEEARMLLIYRYGTVN